MSARNLFSHSFRIAWKDLMELFRNRMELFLLILMPIFMMGMVGFIYPSEASLSNVPVALLNEDMGFLGADFVLLFEEINNNTGMVAITEAQNFDEVREMIQRGDVQGGIILPSNFTSSLVGGKQGTIIVVADQSNPQISAALQGVLKGVFEEMGTMMAQQRLIEEFQVDPAVSLAMVKPFNVQFEDIVSGDFSYFDFVAPGIMAMTVMLSVMTGLPAAISKEKEVGTLDGMMVAPINRLSVILGKTFAQTARGLLQGAVILVLSVTLFGVTIQGNILLVFALLVLGVFSFVGLGVVITSFAKDQSTAVMMMTTLIFPMMFLSGVFFPVEQMPWYMQSISKFLPLTYLASALRKVMVLGAGIPMISFELAVLIGFGTILTAIAVPVFKRAMTR